MRRPLGALILLTACGTAPAKPEAPRARPVASAREPLPAPPKQEAPCTTLAPGLARFADADDVERAHLASVVHHANVVVLGSPHEGSSVASDTLDGVVGGKLLGSFVVVDLRARDGERAPSAGLDAIPAGKPVDLELDRVAPRSLLDVLAELTHLPVDGQPSGSVSVFARRVPSGALLRTLAELAGDARIKSGRLVFGPKASFGETAEPPPMTDCPRVDAAARLVRLPCVAASELRVAGLAREAGDDGRAFALFARRGDAATTIVREGDFVAKEELRVERIACREVVLAGDVSVPLAR